MRKKKGFSLIELLIVVAIILIIAAIAIPNLLRSRMAANEASAAQTLRTLNTAQVAYSTTYASIGYADNLTDLGPNGIQCTDPTKVDSTHAFQIDDVLGCTGGGKCTKGAYNYDMQHITAAGADYFAIAYPVSTSGGSKRFGTLPDAVIRFDTKSPVTTAPAIADVQAMSALSN